ncbi:uncharacterized protein [Musca autumnalis]|uniref:uncharacterized protein n=1 Tax=Musca autumnalis TaxID=221902 RepID=UPI003CEE72C0
MFLFNNSLDKIIVIKGANIGIKHFHHSLWPVANKTFVFPKKYKTGSPTFVNNKLENCRNTNMSSVWKHFDKQEKGKAKCKQCAKVLCCNGSSTSSLIHHMQRIHNIEIDPKPKSSVCEKFSTSDKKGPITKYLKQQRDCIGEILARCVAEDGMSVRAVKNSKAIISLLNYKNMQMPASTSTIWNLIEGEYKSKKNEIIEKLRMLKKENNKFSVIVDEWSDVSHFKHVNISLRTYNPKSRDFELFNLGLEYMKFEGTAENIQKLVSKRLEEFEIDMGRDIVASTHDGAAVMKKYGKNISAKSQLCYNHAIHLSVVDALYAKQCVEEESVEEESLEEESDIEDNYSDVSENDSDKAELEENFELIPDVHSVVMKLRSYVKAFNKSSVKQRSLQSYVKEQEGKELRLICDVKTRWSSMSDMVDSFLRIHKCVNHALLDLQMIPFTANEIEVLTSLSNLLKPLVIAIKELSKNSATLVEAEAIHKFLYNNLKKVECTFNHNLCEKLMTRLEERRQRLLNTLLIYLSSGIFPVSDGILKYSTKTDVKDYANDLYKRLFPEIAIEPSDGSDTDCEMNSEATEPNSLLLDLTQTINCIQNPKNKRKHEKQSTLYDDFGFFDKTKKKTEKLSNLYNALMTISPTSTFSERVFSTCSFIKTKQKNRLQNEHLNCILFLRYYYKQHS